MLESSRGGRKKEAPTHMIIQRGIALVIGFTRDQSNSKSSFDARYDSITKIHVDKDLNKNKEKFLPIIDILFLLDEEAFWSIRKNDK